MAQALAKRPLPPPSAKSSSRMRLAEVKDDEDLPAPLRSVAPVSSGPEIVATDRDGNRYDGNIVADLVEYRELRGASLRGTPLSAPEIARLSELESKMRKPPGGGEDASHLRLFYRYECDFPARLVVSEAQNPISVQVRDISAGGVKLTPVHRLEAGSAVQLMVETDGATVMLPSRVAWMNDSAFGLMFAGAPKRIDNE